MSQTTTRAGGASAGMAIALTIALFRANAVGAAAAPLGSVAAASQPTRPLTVVVTDERTGKPLSGVVVESSWVLKSEMEQPQKLPPASQPTCVTVPRVSVEGKTDERGEVVLQIPGEPLPNGLVKFRRDGFAMAYAAWGVAQRLDAPLEPKRVAAALKPAIEIGGIVKNAEGQPVAGVEVSIYRRFGQTGGPLPAGEVNHQISDRVTTDAAGCWRFAGMPDERPGHLELQLDFEHPDYSAVFDDRHESSADWDELLAKRWVFTIKKDCRPRATLSGRVVDATGKPIAGARITSGDSSFDGRGRVSTTSDEQGRFTLGNIPPDEPAAFNPGDPPATRATVVFVAPGYFWKSLEIDASAAPREDTILLTAAPELRMEVVDGEGRPVAGATVNGPRTADTILIPLAGTTAADGVFTLRDYPDTEFFVRISKDGYQPRELIRADLGGGKVVLNGSPKIAGRVIDAESGKPLEHFRVGLRREQRNRGSVEDRARSMTEFTNGIFELTDRSTATHVRVVLEAEGYLAHETDVFAIGDPATSSLTIELTPAPQTTRRVVSPDGEQLAVGARLTMLSSRRNQHSLVPFFAGMLRLPPNPGPMGEDIDHSESIADESGQLQVRILREMDSAYVHHASGWAYLSGAELRSAEPIRLEPWCSVSGVFSEFGKPVANAEIVLRSSAIRDGRVSFVAASEEYRTSTDAGGHFVFATVLPGYGRIGPAAPADFHWHEPRVRWGFESKPGESTALNLANDGAVVRAKLLVVCDPKRSTSGDVIRDSVLLRRAGPRMPRDLRERGAEAIQAWSDAWRNSDDGKLWQSWPNEYTSVVGNDGTVNFDGVAPGEYTLAYWGWDGRGDGESIEIHANVSVPATAKRGDSIDLGELKPQKPGHALKVGDAAPELTATTRDGAEFRLSSLRGKYVIVDFWATWCGPCRAAMPALRRVAEGFAKAPNVVLLGVSLDDAREDWEAYVKDQALPGTQVLSAGFGGNAVVDTWGVRGIPALFVVGPDGKLLAVRSEAAAAESIIRGALERAAK